MKPIIPFEPIRSDTIPTGDQWIYEVKWDGTRMLTYYDGEKTELYNRKKRNRTHHLPRTFRHLLPTANLIQSFWMEKLLRWQRMENLPFTKQ
jgi:ATP-dependent DNA ligase